MDKESYQSSRAIKRFKTHYLRHLKYISESFRRLERLEIWRWFRVAWPSCGSISVKVIAIYIDIL
jgi:hypothetical protein